MYIYIYMSIALHATHSFEASHVERTLGHSVFTSFGHRPWQISFPLPFFPFKNGWASCSYPTGYVFEEKALLAFRYLLDKDFACLELWLAPYQSTLVAEPGPLGSGSNPLRYFHSIDNIPFDLNSIFIYTSTSCSSFPA